MHDAEREALREEIAQAIDPDAFAGCCGQRHDLWAEEALRAADAVLALPAMVALLAESEPPKTIVVTDEMAHAAFEVLFYSPADYPREIGKYENGFAAVRRAIEVALTKAAKTPVPPTASGDWVNDEIKAVRDLVRVRFGVAPGPAMVRDLLNAALFKGLVASNPPPLTNAENNLLWLSMERERLTIENMRLQSRPALPTKEQIALIIADAVNRADAGQHIEEEIRRMFDLFSGALAAKTSASTRECEHDPHVKATCPDCGHVQCDGSCEWGAPHGGACRPSPVSVPEVTDEMIEAAARAMNAYYGTPHTPDSHYWHVARRALKAALGVTDETREGR